MTTALGLPQRLVGWVAVTAATATAAALPSSAATAAPSAARRVATPPTTRAAAQPTAGLMAGSLAAGRQAAALTRIRLAPSVARTHRLRTLFGNVTVFASASTQGAASGQLGRSGSGVGVACWTTGLDYNSDPIWYRISAPVDGYVAAFNLAAHFAPAESVPHCTSPIFAAVYNSLEVNLRIRKAPSTSAAIAGYLGKVGSKVTLDCYVTGSVILGDPIWYHAESPMTGYVTGRYLNTGGDPALGVPRC
jgi:hypothetical protein